MQDLRCVLFGRLTQPPTHSQGDVRPSVAIYDVYLGLECPGASILAIQLP